MIAALSGTVIYQNEGTLVVDVQGVGYEVSVTASVLDSLDESRTVRIVIFTDVKENSISLFGFKDNLEKEVFLLLKKVKGIGSRTGLNIISSVGAESLLSCIGQGDISSLKRVPGVGNKTAERLIVELREYVIELAKGQGENSFTRANPNYSKVSPIVDRKFSGGIEGDVVLALEKLGFQPDRARQVVAVTVEQNRTNLPSFTSDAGELLRLALINL